jgi:hypothetical protein
MNQPEIVLVSLSLLAGLAETARVMPARTDVPAARDGRQIHFEVRHGRDGQPGPLASPDGRLTMRVVADLHAQIIEAGSGKPVGPVLAHSQRRAGMKIHTWTFSGDGGLLATASSQGEGEDTVGEVRVWEVATGKLLAVATDARYPLGRVHTVAFTDDQTVRIHCDEMSGP